MRPRRRAEKQSFERSCAASSVACGFHASLEAEERQYSEPADWVFPSFRLEGKQPRVANMLVKDHLRSAAVKAGILSSHRDARGQLVDDDPRRFGFHNLRHSLASFLIRMRTDPKTANFASLQRRQANTSVLHSCSQPGSHGRSRENAQSDPRPRCRAKRTESGLHRNCSGLSSSTRPVGETAFNARSECGLRAD